MCSHLPIIAGAKGEPGLAVAEKGQPGPRGQDGEPGLPGANGTQTPSDNQNPANPQPKREDCLLSYWFLCCTFCYQVIRVSLGSLVSQVYQEPRVTLDSQVLDCQDPPELKVTTFLVCVVVFSSFTPELPFISVLFVCAQDSQVSPGSQELLVDQADQELMDVPASLEYLDLRWVQIDKKYL